ncbi:alpha/beta hydrolase [Streptomyces sp. NBC_01451]|uniref:alpha/beta hydrolase n=1 Tax=Streptomyces sp. NBC_01451 TaxID=2903872 RepID=UPI002E34E8A7|nr:alpha/beta hydrolase [Streptomyces sp. NBC_01451]
MTTYVLVHGGLCHQDVTPLLQTAGRTARTSTGLAEQSHLLSPDIDLDFDLRVNGIIQVLHDVVLGGHRYGGMVITSIAARAADRIKHLAHLDAAAPWNGMSLADAAAQSMVTSRAEAQVVDGVGLVRHLDDERTPHHGVIEPDDVAWMTPKLTPALSCASTRSCALSTRQRSGRYREATTPHCPAGPPTERPRRRRNP